MAAKKKKARSAEASDAVPIDSTSPQVLRRLDRIHDNYQQLEQLLTSLESRLPKHETTEPTSPPNKPR